MLRSFVVDQVAVTRAPRHIVHIAEGINDENVHERWQHESNEEKKRSPYKYCIMVGRIEKSCPWTIEQTMMTKVDAPAAKSTNASTVVME